MVLFTPTKVLANNKKYRAEDTTLTTRRRSLPGVRHFVVKSYLHTATPLVCEINQSAFRRLLNADEL
jgi:hypothetical protein